MTPRELDQLRLTLALHCKDALLRWLVRRVAIAEGLHPDDVKQSLRLAAAQNLNTLRQEYTELTVQNVNAASSDLLASEALEAFEFESQKIHELLAALGCK